MPEMHAGHWIALFALAAAALWFVLDVAGRFLSMTDVEEDERGRPAWLDALDVDAPTLGDGKEGD
jgi:hypothetical protein